MKCKNKRCEEYNYNACCFFCKDKDVCAFSCSKDPTACGKLEEEKTKEAER